ncbi:MAG: IMPACT family protein [Acholeplasmataceae bacterium]
MIRLDFSTPQELIIKKSRFISECHDINNKDDVQMTLNYLWSIHPKASHICYGYILDEKHYGYDDNHEPKGTAGKPILDVLLKQNVNYVLCTVIRYYGGVMLGASGLTKAYRDTSTLAITQATFKTMQLVQCYDIIMSYDLHPKMKQTLLSHGDIIDETFTDVVIVRILWNQSKEALSMLTYGVQNIIFIQDVWEQKKP